jgi:transposase
MEATNVYWEALAAFLHAQGYTVSVVNNLQSLAAMRVWRAG